MQDESSSKPSAAKGTFLCSLREPINKVGSTGFILEKINMNNNTNNVIVVAPSLDTRTNVSGVSAVVNFIIDNNKNIRYEHFLQGKSDLDNGGFLHRVIRIICNYRKWKSLLCEKNGYLIHYNFPLDAPSIIRDYFFIRYAVKHNMPIVIHLHGGLYLFKEKKPWIIKKMLNHIFSWPCQFIVLSKKEKNAIENEYGTDNVTVLPNCVDLREAKVFERDNCHDETLHILYLGRIEPNKGVDYILKAAEQLKNNDINFLLHIAGKDQCQDYYVTLFKESLKENFTYEGVVTGTAKTELLKKCQVFLLPSFYEGLPMSLLEAMSFGEVPVVTNVGSIGEVVKNGENGMFVNVKDSHTIVEAVTRLYSDRELLQELSTESKSTILNQFSPEEYINKLNTIYDNYKIR